MRTEELEMTKQRYMKKMRAGKLTGEELMLLMEINDQLAEETSRIALETLAEARQILNQANLILSGNPLESFGNASKQLDIVIADGSKMYMDGVQKMIDRIADGMILVKAEYNVCDLTVTLARPTDEP
jgi:hypothetical protein